jgi:amino acid transporter
MTASTHARPQLSLLSAIVLVAGLVIGAGIFKTPSLIAGLVGADQILWIWCAAALLSLIGALCYVELITRFPNESTKWAYEKITKNETMSDMN